MEALDIFYPERILTKYFGTNVVSLVERTKSNLMKKKQENYLRKLQKINSDFNDS